MAWVIWNYRNHSLHTTDGTKISDIIDCIYKKATHYFQSGMIGPPIIFYFIFFLKIHTLLSFRVCQGLTWLAATSIEHKFSQYNLSRKTHLLNIDQLLLRRIFTSNIILDLSTFEQFPTLRKS